VIGYFVMLAAIGFHPGPPPRGAAPASHAAAVLPDAANSTERP
jgi:hypothetical protein